MKNQMLRSTFLLAGFTLASGTALAQTAEPLLLEEIIVTARKRAESLQETPQAITAFSAADITEARITSIDDVAKLTPGLNYAPLFGPAAATPIIRGSTQTFGAPNVGVFIDGIYLTGKPAMDIALADLQRIEVIKGPQNALYGRNTFAGAINYITKAPQMTVGGDAELTVGSHGMLEGRASITGPVIADKLALRLGVSHKEFDGYYRSSIDNGRIDFEKSQGVAADALFTPTEALKARLRFSYAKDDSGQPASAVVRANGIVRTVPVALNGGIPVGSPQTYVGELPELGKYLPVNTRRSIAAEPNDYGNRQETYRTSLSLDYDLDAMTLTSVTAYNKRDNEYQIDGDNTICEETLGCRNFGPPLPTFRPIAYRQSQFATSSEDNTTKDFSQELRVSSPDEGQFRWIVGGFYYWSKLSAVQRSLSPMLPAPPAFGYPLSKLGTEAKSLFASVAYDVTDALTVTAEARQEWEDQTYKQRPTVTTGVTAGDASLRNINLKQDFKFFTPRFIVDYKISDDVMAYANVAKGTKTGGFNTGLRVLESQLTYQEESSWNYEAGLKTTWLGGRATTNLAYFHTDWKDQQVACQNPVSVGGSSTQRTYTCNVGQAVINGIEVDAQVRLTDILTASVGYSWTDATYEKFVDDSLTATLAAGGLPAMNFDGKSLPYVPKNKLFASLKADFNLSADTEMFMRADVNYQSKSYIRADNLAYIGDKTVADFRTGLRFDNGISATLFVENAFDDRTPLTAVRFFDSVNFSIPAPLVTGAVGRKAGVTVNYTF